MAIEVKLPRLGQGMESGTIVRWLKTEGDAVAKGEPLYELDTDKVTQEVEAESDGVLLKIVVSDGEVDVGTTVGIIGAQDEDVSELLAARRAATATRPRRRPRRRRHGEQASATSGRDAPPSRRARTQRRVTRIPRRRRAPRSEARDVRRLGADGERVKASPLARRIARERGIDLAAITGTGPEGRVIAEDVEKAAAAPARGRGAALPAPRRRGRRAHLDPQDDRAPADRGMGGAGLPAHRHGRRDRARRDARAAWSSSCARARRSRRSTTCSRGSSPRRSCATGRSTRTSSTGKIHRFPTANVGIAVAAPAGLVVPVIRDADRKSVQEIAAVRADLVSRARDGKLQLADLEGGTFTISNLGMYGIEQFVAVLNPPQVAILAVGSIEDRPIVVDGELAIVPTHDDDADVRPPRDRRLRGRGVPPRRQGVRRGARAGALASSHGHPAGRSAGRPVPPRHAPPRVLLARAEPRRGARAGRALRQGLGAAGRHGAHRDRRRLPGRRGLVPPLPARRARATGSSTRRRRSSRSRSCRAGADGGSARRCSTRSASGRAPTATARSA